MVEVRVWRLGAARMPSNRRVVRGRGECGSRRVRLQVRTGLRIEIVELDGRRGRVLLSVWCRAASDGVEAGRVLSRGDGCGAGAWWLCVRMS